MSTLNMLLYCGVIIFMMLVNYIVRRKLEACIDARDRLIFQMAREIEYLRAYREQAEMDKRDP